MPLAAHSLVFALPVVMAALACGSGSGGRLDTPTAPTVEVGKEFTLAPGQVATLGNGALALTFKAVDGDSRCPTGAQCIWEGDAKVVISVTRTGQTKDHELHTSARYEKVATEGGFEIELVKLDPYPAEGRSIAAADYRATLKVGAGTTK